MAGHWFKIFRSITPRPARALAILILLAFTALVGAMVGCHLWALEKYRAAQQALERRQFAQAAADLSFCLKVWPSSAETHFLAARAARRRHLYDDADRHLQACQDAGWRPDRVKLERLLIRAQGGELSVHSDLWSRVEENDEDTVQILEVLIQEYIRTSQFRAAMRCFEVFFRHRPDDVEALLGRGWVWEQVFHFENAVPDYRRAVELEPQNHKARRRLAETLLITGPASEAAGHFEYLAREQPDDPAALLGLARCRRQLGQIAEAKQLLEQLLRKDPQHAAALEERGKAALDEGEPAAAEPWLRSAVARTPFDREANYNLWQCLQKLGHKAEAQKYQTRYEHINSDMKRLDELIRKTLQFPSDPALRYEIGTIFLRNGEEQKGVRWLHLALEYDPRHQPTHKALAEYYKGIGQAEQAAYHLRFIR